MYVWMVERYLNLIFPAAALTMFYMHYSPVYTYTDMVDIHTIKSERSGCFCISLFTGGYFESTWNIRKIWNYTFLNLKLNLVCLRVPQLRWIRILLWRENTISLWAVQNTYIERRQPIGFWIFTHVVWRLVHIFSYVARRRGGGGSENVPQTWYSGHRNSEGIVQRRPWTFTFSSAGYLYTFSAYSHWRAVLQKVSVPAFSTWIVWDVWLAWYFDQDRLFASSRNSPLTDWGCLREIEQKLWKRPRELIDCRSSILFCVVHLNLFSIVTVKYVPTLNSRFVRLFFQRQRWIQKWRKCLPRQVCSSIVNLSVSFPYHHVASLL